MTHGSAKRDLRLGFLARVEGETSLRVVLEDGVASEVALDIFEPPRFFEALLRGRSYLEAPEITSRICGICPVAYEMSACAAIEDACGVSVPPEITRLRRLLYCGEWIQSHVLHIYLLHAPDFLGCTDAVELAGRDRAAVARGLELKRIGNLIMEAVGGRAVHPVNVRVGGFYRSPDRSAIAALAEPLRRAREAALATVEWVAGFEFPDLEVDYRFVSLKGEEAYPIESGAIASSDGLLTGANEFAELAHEEQVSYSTALHARLRGEDSYLTGPLARYALNSARLSPLAREAAESAGLGETCRNPFRSIVVRAVEVVFACDEALRLVEEYEPPTSPALEVPPREASGAGATEAPRGLLLHRYEIDAEGLIASARIVAPTSQNLVVIEDDVRRVVEGSLSLGDDELAHRCEQAVRNHDPCISCAAHFLDLTIERRG